MYNVTKSIWKRTILTKTADGMHVGVQRLHLSYAVIQNCAIISNRASMKVKVYNIILEYVPKLRNCIIKNCYYVEWSL